ncbi:MAG TPA: MFS transporter, partial [archaeon]|nr:MFS transporter [archaeon]
MDNPKHPLRGLLIVQFLGAFNDNAWKLIVALLAIRAVAAQVGRSGPAFEAASQTQTTIAFAVFTLPLMLVSLPAGVLADRVSKRSVIITMKAIEVCLMAGATLALSIRPSDWVLPLVVLGLMGAHSALFSPAKYGILPEILPHEQLSSGNGLLELWTFLAIISGTVAGGVLLDWAGESAWISGLVLTTLAGLGFLVSWTVPRVPPARSQGGITTTFKIASDTLRSDRILRLAVLGSIFFWTIASLASQDILVYGKTVLGLTDRLVGVPLAMLAIGTGFGAAMAGKLSASKVEYGLLPLGAIGLTVFLLLLGIFSPGLSGVLIIMALLGIASGMLDVPLNALIQWRSPDDRRGAVIALSNSFIFGGILLGSLSAKILSEIGLSASGILLAVSAVTAVGTGWALWLLPDAMLRLVLVLLTHTFYRLTVVSREHVPERGGALLVPNHVTFIDGLFLLASLDRPIRFVMEARYYHHPFLRPFVKSLGAIPISATGGPRLVLRALRDAGRYLDQGELVCIFPEGQLTRTGMLLPFRRGFERLAKGRTVPIIPVHIDRIWGSIFSYAGGRFLTKIPERIPYPATVSFGVPLPSTTPAHAVRQAVQDLSEAAWTLRKKECRPLHAAFIRGMRRRPFRLMFADATQPRVSRLQALAGAIALCRALGPAWKEQESVGILLPPSVAGALVNTAATLAGRISVNLNYTAGRIGIESAIRQARLQTVVTSRTFIERVKLDLPEGIQPLWVEDIMGTIDHCSRLRALLIALFGPLRLIERTCGMVRRPTTDDVATIIFSSGSTGDPKGVMLTHFNVQANVEAVAQAFPVQP